jgi:D-glycero-D-manno-heptose 1,7-bisphosphate phosphatase
MGIDQIVNKAIFLDRDGVMIKAVIKNGKPYPVKTVSEVEIIKGLQEVLLQIKQHNFLLIGITNQPDVARGTQSRENVESINHFLEEQLFLDKMFTCYHDNNDHCECRKPKPGMLLEAANEFNIDLHESFMVGDRWSDIEAGRNAGCQTIFVNYQYAEKQAEGYNYLVDSPANIKDIIIRSIA